MGAAAGTGIAAFDGNHPDRARQFVVKFAGGSFGGLFSIHPFSSYGEVGLDMLVGQFLCLGDFFR